MSSSERGVGRTPLIKVKELCGQCNDATVFVKDESRNPFGTFKDRRCAALLDKYKGKEQLVFVHITSGNSGYSLGMMAEEERRKTGKDIRVINIVGRGTPKIIVERLKACSTVVELDLGSQVGIDALRAAAMESAGYSVPASNIVAVEEYHIANGYSNIIREIHEEGINPKYVFCPVGGGELLVELTDAAKEIWGEDAPKIVGITIKQNVLQRSKDFISKIGKSIADKLVAPYSMYKDLVQNRVNAGSAELMATNPREHEIAKEYEFLNRIGINAEPSAAVAFLGAKNYGLTSDDTVVIINSGKGLYDASSIHRVFRYKLKNFMKAAAFFAASAVFALGVKFGYDQYKDYKSRQHWDLATEVGLIAENGWGVVNIDEEKISSLCIQLPDMNKEKCEHVRATYMLTERQIRYLITMNADTIKLRSLCNRRLPDMSGEKCGRLTSPSQLTERQLRFISQLNNIDKDNLFIPFMILQREWFLLYPTWMPGEGAPETYEVDRYGTVINRKTKPEFLTPSAECDLRKERGVRLPGSIDTCP